MSSFPVSPSLRVQILLIQLPSGCTQMTCALELNISGAVNVAMPISLVGFVTGTRTLAYRGTPHTHAVGSRVFYE
jgi:hypothetical protein